jgi:hypothetical protein
MPFYETGKVKKKPLGEDDIEIVVDLLKEIRPHRIYAAGDLSDPHGTHRTCLAAIMDRGAPAQGPGLDDRLRGVALPRRVAGVGPHEIEMAVPLSPSEVERKRMAIFKHQSQKDRALFPGPTTRASSGSAPRTATANRRSSTTRSGCPSTRRSRASCTGRRATRTRRWSRPSLAAAVKPVRTRGDRACSGSARGRCVRVAGGACRAKVSETGLRCGAARARPDPPGAWELEAKRDRSRQRGHPVVSGMLETKGEDYSTLEAIKAHRRASARRRLGRERERAGASRGSPRIWGIGLVTFHAGVHPARRGRPRAEDACSIGCAMVADLFADHGVRRARDRAGGRRDAPRGARRSRDEAWA